MPSPVLERNDIPSFVVGRILTQKRGSENAEVLHQRSGIHWETWANAPRPEQVRGQEADARSDIFAFWGGAVRLDPM
jgi:hypothetical protein